MTQTLSRVVGLIWLIGLVIAPPAANAGAPEVFVFIPGAKGEQTSSHLHDRGYVRKGSRIRLGIRVDEPNSLTLSYRNPAGHKRGLFKDVDFDPGTFLMVPNQNEWFTMDGDPGPYTFVLEQRDGPEVTRVVNVIISDALSPELGMSTAETNHDINVTAAWPSPQEVEANLRNAKDLVERSASVTAPVGICCALNRIACKTGDTCTSVSRPTNVQLIQPLFKPNPQRFLTHTSHHYVLP